MTSRSLLGIQMDKAIVHKAMTFRLTGLDKDALKGGAGNKAIGRINECRLDFVRIYVAR